LKKNQKKGVTICGLQALATIDQFVADLQGDEALQVRTPRGRPSGSTINASKTLEDCKRKAFDNAAAISTKFKTTRKLPRGGLRQIIERSKVQNGVENEQPWTISANSVRS
jgi:hypothetical protein